MNRRRKTRDEDAALGAGNDFLELAAHGALAGRVSGALHVGAILKQRQYAFFAVLGEGVQIEEPIVGRCGIYVEIAGVDDDSNRGVNGESDAIHQTVSDLDGMNGERPDAKALAADNGM